MQKNRFDTCSGRRDNRWMSIGMRTDCFSYDDSLLPNIVGSQRNGCACYFHQLLKSHMTFVSEAEMYILRLVFKSAFSNITKGKGVHIR